MEEVKLAYGHSDRAHHNTLGSHKGAQIIKQKVHSILKTNTENRRRSPFSFYGAQL